MSEVHDSGIWSLDRRPIIAACLPDHPAHDIMLAIDGWAFERIERNGEMAPIPFLRCTKDGVSVEAALRCFAWIEAEEIKHDQ